MKAQLWSTDFAAATLIFFSAIAIIVFFFNFAVTENSVQSEFIKMQQAALRASDSLIRLEGFPGNWSGDTVSVIGLASEENILESSKIKEFIQMDYDKARVLLVGKYQFYFEILNLDGNVMTVDGLNITKGNISQDATTVIPIERYAIYNGTLTKVRISIWD